MKKLLIILAFSLLANFTQAKTVLVHTDGHCLHIHKVELSETTNRFYIKIWENVTTCQSPTQYQRPSSQFDINLYAFDLNAMADGSKSIWQNNLSQAYTVLQAEAAYKFTNADGWTLTEI